MSAVTTYPVRVEGELQPDLSRWLWIVKWVLALPHFVCLAFLWAAFIVVTVVSFVAVLFTGRYPRSLSTSTSACCAGRGASASTRSARSGRIASRPSRCATSRSIRLASTSSIRSTSRAARG